ncbi:Transcriptional regulatory protein ZraR [Fundidesulfovibrio magnetotacticus]|uniref:Transcriptional regulatory protein ZraR n=1 Tax=Fundidesulfovibrio magnetotacticus TaxID=2730080 RepID=A0A6V8M0Q2_9BACT|nr:sigma-54 dependent transcriptional regulator [Fundidesulfovibrio magnetotacticus]GFK95819.1 Transcriptional regulatory protein ZraR [Fundidesulfovibrio magnetotacticus]
MSTILVIDDDPEIRGTFQSLSRRMRFDFLGAGTLAEGLALLRTSQVDVVLLDIRLPDGNGLEALPAVRRGDNPPEVIILTGLGDPDGAEVAISGGAWDYLVKPAPIKQTMLSLTRALKYHKEKEQAGATVALRREGVVGSSPRMEACLDQVAQASRLTGPVLVTGETGTGKELMARTVHANSMRSSGEFVAVDCASLTETLLESTLFGHRKGSFTGADQDRPGLVKLADGGTLFLDEVGEMPMTIQKAFLRVLQEKRFRPVGASVEIQSDFRLIAATNRDLEEMAARGEFRQDLLFRLKTFVIALPPLRERREDIKSLAASHLTDLCERYGLPTKGMGTDFSDMLMAYSWPGNVRELFGVMERSLASAGNEPTLYAKHLPVEVRLHVMKANMERVRPAEPAAPLPGPVGLCAGMLTTLKAFKEAKEREYLDALLFQCGKDLQAMLDTSGLSRSHFYALLKKHNMTL